MCFLVPELGGNFTFATRQSSFVMTARMMIPILDLSPVILCIATGISWLR